MVILPVMMGILTMEQYIYIYVHIIYIYVSAQILILHQPRFAWNKLNKGISQNLSYLLRAQVGRWGRNEIWPDICMYMCTKNLYGINKTRWWFQPNSKILVKIGIFPKFRGENKKYLKPPPRKGLPGFPIVSHVFPFLSPTLHLKKHLHLVGVVVTPLVPRLHRRWVERRLHRKSNCWRPVGPKNHWIGRLGGNIGFVTVRCWEKV